MHRTLHGPVLGM